MFILPIALFFGSLSLRALEPAASGAPLTQDEAERVSETSSDPALAKLRPDPARIEADIRTLASFGTRHTLSDVESTTRGIGAARRWIRSEFDRIGREHHGGRLRVEFARHEVVAGRRVPEGAAVVNVVATLPGRNPKRLLVVSGHYDSMPTSVMDVEADAPGANDDASGVAVVLECARLLGGLEPEATVVFIAVAGEEQGLLGARAQAQSWKREDFAVDAFITNDIVGGARGSNGRLEPDRVRLFSEGVPSGGGRVTGSDNDAPSRQLARYLREVAQQTQPDFEVQLIFRQDRYLRGGDHRAFNDEGFAGVRFTEPNENYQHQHQNVRESDGVLYGDRPENLDFGFIARVSGVNAEGLRALALAPGSPRRVSMDISKLTPDTLLYWLPPEGTEPAGYRVRMRRTHEPFWTEVRDVGPEREALLEGYSKDNWLFAVEAYGPDGSRSLPIYPSPRRRRESTDRTPRRP